jgi:hypothetical protein
LKFEFFFKHVRDGQNFTEVEKIFRAFEQIEFLLPLLDISLFNIFLEYFISDLDVDHIYFIYVKLRKKLSEEM